jgi:transposase-like protein
MSQETTPTLALLRARWAEQYAERPSCPHGCRGPVWHDGGRRRKATLQLDDSSVFVPDADQRRKVCAVCGSGWTHRPEGISSRAHYQPCVVSQALAALGSDPAASTVTVAAELGCAPSTIRRWSARVAALAEPAVLASALVEEAGEPVLPAVPVELAAPQRSPRLRALLLRALTVIALLEALASLRGLAPPALAHAPLLIPADAPSLVSRGDPSLPT